MTFPGRRVVAASGFAAAIAICPMIAPFPNAATPSASCPPGQTEDPYTFACVSDFAPNGGAGGVGAPSENDLTQCSGRDQGQCLEGDLYAPAPVQQPDTSVHQSP